jgi:mono/diheme cytochrome c family protein
MRSFWIALGVVVLLIAGICIAQVGQKTRPVKQPRDPDAALLKHGEYLAKFVSHCSGCHTPPDTKGHPDKTRLLQGTSLPIQPKKEMKNWADQSPDITRSGLAGMWSEADMVKFLMTGKDPEGKKARPPMPPFRLHERDALAVAKYLRSLPGKK